MKVSWAVQSSTFRVEKTRIARIKEIVPSSGYKSVSLKGVWRVYFEVGSGNAEVGSGNQKTEFGIERFESISDNCEQNLSVVTFEPLAQTWHFKMWWWKPNSLKYESYFRDTSRRTLRGVGSEPQATSRRLRAGGYEPEARAGLNPEPGTQFRYL